MVIYRGFTHKKMVMFHGYVRYIYICTYLLVGGLEHGFYDFSYIGNVIIPTD